MFVARKARSVLAIVVLAGAAIGGLAPVSARHIKATFPAPPDRAQWKVSIRPISATYSLGEPVFVDLTIQNLSFRPATVDLGANGKTNLLVTTMELGGLSKPVRLWSGGFMMSGKHLIGARATYTERLVLSEWNAFCESGVYRVKFALIPEFGPKADDPPTTDLQISIGPRDTARLSALAKTLADRVINSYDARDQIEADLALSYVTDPVAIPEMERVLGRGGLVGSDLIWALARIGGPEALSAIRLAQNSRDEGTRSMARYAVWQLHEGKPLMAPQPVD